jgi:hypothetical protein
MWRGRALVEGYSFALIEFGAGASLLTGPFDLDKRTKVARGDGAACPGHALRPIDNRAPEDAMSPRHTVEKTGLW